MSLRSRFSTLLVLFAALLGLSGTARAAEPEQQIILLGAGAPDWRAARTIIEEHGGRIGHVFPPDVLVGLIPPSAAEALAEAPGGGSGFEFIRNRADAERMLARGVVDPTFGRGDRRPEIVAALRLLAPQPSPIERDPMYRLNSDGSIDVRPITDFVAPALEEPRDRGFMEPGVPTAIGNTADHTTEFMAGDVAVAILRPESTGVGQASTEDWTAGEVTNTLTQITTALNQILNDSPNGRLTFVYRTESFGPGVAGTVSCDCEAITTANWTDSAVLSFLGKLGYTAGTGYSRLHEWVNDVRTDLGTDWAFGVIVVDNSSDTSKGRASAYLNGPAQWLFQSNNSSVFRHETGHTFGAMDEYHPDAARSPTQLIGYTQEPNANSQYSDGTGFFSGAGEGILNLMINNSAYISPWARGAWGTWDLDGDGIYEPQDTFATVTLNAPSGSAALTLTGTATASALKFESGWNASSDIVINRISQVEWRINGGPWQNATPSDGSFNASSENFTFTTPSLRDGVYVFEARARDNFGNTTNLFPRRTATVTGSGTTNNVPQAALFVSPSVGSTATTFNLSATGSIDAEDATNLQYRWDFDNNGSYDTGLSATSSTTTTYGTAGTKTAKVEVRDASGVTTTRTVTFTVAASNVVPTARFTVDKGSLFASSPAIFNFDASGVTDGETTTPNLEVRWDFDDDGTWDTGYSTTKTTSKNYAQGLPVTVSQETLVTYLYNAASGVTGLAQSFVASGTTIGKADLNLGVFGDATPGGTITVGIMGTLGPAANFLTSVTRNQSAISHGAMATFDFPDINVTNGGTYYLVLIGSDSDISWGASTTTSTYAGGEHHYSFNAGSTWNSDATRDHVFRIYSGTATTVPLTKSQAWRVRMEVKDAAGQTAQAVRDIWTNAYNTPPTVTLGSSATSGTTATTFNLTATGADANSATTWDGMVHYRWDVDGDGNFETEFSATNTRSASFATPGKYNATVEVRDRYHATARASVLLTVEATGAPSRIAINAGNNQTASIGAAVATDPSVIVRDSSNTPVAGATVVFQASPGSGTVTQATQVTNGSGIATVDSWVLGAAGANTLTATLIAFPASVTFNATGNATPKPIVTTNAATSITISGATLNGSVNPNGASTTASFEYGLTTAYGSTTTGVALGSGTSAVPTSAAITGLTCGTAYNYRVTATNVHGTSTGSNQTFTTSACPVPVVTTQAATSITTAGATLNASVNPNGFSTNASFEYGLTTAYGSTTGNVALGSGSSAVPTNVAVTGLACGTTYNYRARATNSFGTTNGSNLTFTTTACPSLSINNVSTTEGNSGTKLLTFTVALSAASAANVTVNYATANNTATSGSDYVAVGTTSLTFTTGQTSKSVSITINGDTVDENDETFYVNLSNPVNASISDSQGVGTIIDDDDPVAAMITSPAPSSTLTGASVTFQWNAGSNVNEYWLDIGTTAGGTQIFTGSKGAALSHSATGLPTNGSTIYVRLWSRSTLNPATWISNSYTFTAANIVPVAAAITSPANGSTLAGANATFQWNAGASIVEYWLEIGTTAGGTQIFTGSLGTSLSHPATGLPTSGETIYVRLWSKPNAGPWLVNSYTYTAFDTRPSITAPAPGSTLASSSVTFQWSAGTGNVEFWLDIGSTLNGNDIFAGSKGAGLSHAATGLPTDGRTIYLRLWWKTAANAWFSKNYTFTAQNIPPVAAAITSPANGSTLSSGSPTFSWNAGTNIAEYWLQIGNVAGGSDLFNATKGLNLSHAASGLPLDGRTLYVTLWSRSGSTWLSNSYTYTAFDPRAAITSPANGSTLAGANVTFSWTAGIGVLEYWLEVGTTPGGRDLVNLSKGTSLSHAATGLPADGRTLYATLWSRVGTTTWLSRTYTYKAFNPSATMTGPAHGSVLAGANATFQWTPGTGIAEYWLEIGTTPGGAQLYGASQGLSLSYPAAGLPVNGTTLYVRLWSMTTSGVWLSRDYIYQGAGSQAALTAPILGSTFAGSTVTFNWTAGTGNNEFWLEAGSAPGGHDLVNLSTGLTQTHTTTTMPVDGRTVYVRLWSRSGATWLARDYIFKAFQP